MDRQTKIEISVGESSLKDSSFPTSATLENADTMALSDIKVELSKVLERIKHLRAGAEGDPSLASAQDEQLLEACRAELIQINKLCSSAVSQLAAIEKAHPDYVPPKPFDYVKFRASIKPPFQPS